MNPKRCASCSAENHPVRVRLLREAGGLGDVVCAMGCATAITRACPDARVTLVSLEHYRELVGLCPDVHQFIGVGAARRPRDAMPDPDRYRYLRDGRYDATVDLFCPGWRYEWATQGLVTKGRCQIFCETTAATTGLPLTPTPPAIRLTDYDRGRADGWLQGQGIDLARPIVALQPQASLTARRWPNARWVEFVELVRAAAPYTQFICFGTQHDMRQLSRDLGATPVIYQRERLVASLLARSVLLVGVDSGLYHLAAATGTPAIGLFGLTSGAATSAWYSQAVYLEAGDAERRAAGVDCTRHCHNMPSAGKQTRCNVEPCPAMAALSPKAVAVITLTRLASRT